MPQPLCAWPGCGEPPRQRTRGSAPLYCSPQHADLAKHARARRKVDPAGDGFMWALVEGAREELARARAEELAAHHGRVAAELATMLDELLGEDILAPTPGGWTLSAALDLAGVRRRLHKPGRNPGPSVRKPGENAGPAGRKPGGNAAATGGRCGSAGPATACASALLPLPPPSHDATPAGSSKMAALTAAVPPGCERGPSRAPGAGPCEASAEQGRAAACSAALVLPMGPAAGASPDAPALRVLDGDKLDGGTKLRLPGAPLPVRRSGRVELEGLTFNVEPRGPYGRALVHREAAIYLYGDSIHLKADKRGLRGLGEEEWFAKWLDIATRVARGTGCASIQDAEAAGWRVDLAEIALDVVGLPVPRDAENFSTVTDDRHAALYIGPDGRPSWLCPTGTPRPRDGLGLTLQDKSQWARSRKGGRRADLLDHPDEGPLLEAQGLRRGEAVTRFEAHLSGRALCVHDARSGTPFYDVGCVFRPTWPPVPAAPGHPVRRHPSAIGAQRRLPASGSERSDGLLDRWGLTSREGTLG